MAAIETAGTGGRRHQDLPLWQARACLPPFLARLAPGALVTGAPLQRTVEEGVNQPGAPSSSARLLERHGWRPLAARCRPAPASGGQPTGGKSASAPARRPPPPPKSQLASAHTGETAEPSKPSPPKANRQFSPQGYPSALTEEEWTILDPLLPPAKPGGYPPSTDMRAVSNALLSLDRTGGKLRAFLHE